MNENSFENIRLINFLSSEDQCIERNLSRTEPTRMFHQDMRVINVSESFMLEVTIPEFKLDVSTKSLLLDCQKIASQRLNILESFARAGKNYPV